MTFETWKDDYGLVYEPNYCKGTEADCRAAFQAGAASRDAEILQLQKLADEVHAARKVNAEHDRLLVKIAAKDTEIAELKDALGYDLDKYKASQMALRECMQMVVEQDAEIAELVAALKPFGAIDLVESRLPAEFAMLVLRARAAIAKVRKP